MHIVFTHPSILPPPTTWGGLIGRWTWDGRVSHVPANVYEQAGRTLHRFVIINVEQKHACRKTRLLIIRDSIPCRVIAARILTSPRQNKRFCASTLIPQLDIVSIPTQQYPQQRHYNQMHMVMVNDLA
nr:hypothetical protein HmN_000177800 [Hymenolepis microstoma]